VKEVGWTDEARVAALLARRARRKKAGGNDEDVKKKEPADVAGARRAGQAVRGARGREDASRRGAANRAGQDAQNRAVKDARDRARRVSDTKKAEAEKKKGSGKSDDAAKQTAIKSDITDTKYSMTLAKREMADIRKTINARGRATPAQLSRYEELETFMGQMRRRVSELEHSLKGKRKA
jgi:hypothetical protein